MSKNLKIMWIDGQCSMSGDRVPSKLALRRDDDSCGKRFRWYGQAYNDRTGKPSGYPDQDTEVSGDTVADAMAQAESAWRGDWNLRNSREG
jgi:hypothetical protein